MQYEKENRTFHGVEFWKRRIYELAVQFNLFRENKIDCDRIFERIGDDIDRAQTEYSMLQDEYIVYIRCNFFKKKRKK